MLPKRRVCVLCDDITAEAQWTELWLQVLDSTFIPLGGICVLSLIQAQMETGSCSYSGIPKWPQARERNLQKHVHSHTSLYLYSHILNKYKCTQAHKGCGFCTTDRRSSQTGTHPETSRGRIPGGILTGCLNVLSALTLTTLQRTPSAAWIQDLVLSGSIMTCWPEVRVEKYGPVNRELCLSQG